jgi:AcrR family transcriptional regulator
MRGPIKLSDEVATESGRAVAVRRGPGGRPSREEAERRHRTLLETAIRLFLERGLEGVSLEEIAQAAGVAKRFIYARYADKADLFVGAIERFAEVTRGPLHDFTPPPEADAETGLTEFAGRLLALALSPEALALHRQFIVAAPRFPRLARLFVERNRDRALADIVRVLETYAARGEIAAPDPQFLAEQFFIAVVGIPQRMALIGMTDPPEQQERRLRAAVALFLEGCRTRR